MKWQAVGVLASSSNGLAREEAAAVIAALDGLLATLGSDLAPEVVQQVEDRLESLARARDHAPLVRGAGR